MYYFILQNNAYDERLDEINEKNRIYWNKSLLPGCEIQLYNGEWLFDKNFKSSKRKINLYI